MEFENVLGERQNATCFDVYTLSNASYNLVTNKDIQIELPVRVVIEANPPREDQIQRALDIIANSPPFRHVVLWRDPGADILMALRDRLQEVDWIDVTVQTVNGVDGFFEMLQTLDLPVALTFCYVQDMVNSVEHLTRLGHRFKSLTLMDARGEIDTLCHHLPIFPLQRLDISTFMCQKDLKIECDGLEILVLRSFAAGCLYLPPKVGLVKLTDCIVTELSPPIYHHCILSNVGVLRTLCLSGTGYGSIIASGCCDLKKLEFEPGHSEGCLQLNNCLELDTIINPPSNLRVLKLIKCPLVSVEGVSGVDMLHTDIDGSKLGGILDKSPGAKVYIVENKQDEYVFPANIFTAQMVSIVCRKLVFPVVYQRYLSTRVVMYNTESTHGLRQSLEHAFGIFHIEGAPDCRDLVERRYAAMANQKRLQLMLLCYNRAQKRRTLPSLPTELLDSIIWFWVWSF